MERSGVQVSFSRRSWGSLRTIFEIGRSDAAPGAALQAGQGARTLLRRRALRVRILFYALYAIAAFIEPTSFSLATPADRRKVSPTKTETAFAAAFPGDPILMTISALFADPSYQEWQRIRNVLTHRTAPGRMMYVGIGNDDAPATEWKLDNIPLDKALVPTRRAALARALTALLEGIETFVRAKV